MDNRAYRPDENPAALAHLAHEVLKNYGISSENISVIQSGGIKTVWKISSDAGKLCLKRLRQTLDKALFSVNAQIHIKKAGGKVPAVLLNSEGKAITEYRGQLFVLYEWLEGRDLDFGSREGLKAAFEGLAAFHISSKGYEPPRDAKVSSKLQKWPEQYQSMRKKLLLWKDSAKLQPSTPPHSEYLKHIDSMTALADKALWLIEKSNYLELTSSKSKVTVLCHQDFGKGNAIMTDQGVYVLDLDGVTFDLPVRDLRKLIGKRAENKMSWDASAVNEVVEWYNSVNPMSGEETKLLYIDLLYPHWFYGLVKNLYLNGKPLKASEIEKIAKLELSKSTVLKELLGKEW